MKSKLSRSEVAWIDTMAHGQDAMYGESIGDSGQPAIYPLLALGHTLVFPKMVAPLTASREDMLAAVDVAMAEDQVLVAVAQRDPSEDELAPEDVYSVGVEIKVLRMLRMPDGSTSILAQGRQRVRIEEIVVEGPYLSAIVTPLPDIASSGVSAEPLMRAVLSLFERCLDLNPALPDEAYVAAINAVEPGALADLVAATIAADLAARQDVLECRDPRAWRAGRAEPGDCSSGTKDPGRAAAGAGACASRSRAAPPGCHALPVA